ncbi:hypothetical protein ASPWEDRAFT_169267 [Aspergillus wentii DTO 134E9]|uniref:Acyltransferase 3 domain-containing protein n=1 Tax=Aspergillus wentii DTO 134E9 TaxID=1073089 RepID=A0A1L9RWV0_ASPWE|nr:uncharacterized protein ASPWEDRAFT_169267 [Aspergillus wentii DTO 134E9]KAI9928898.1 hypothetical protein MW887_001291 [Aspergillus wentii]OJJ39420.1 hypothetical protein ASPWEDRAFT_169267 [Aspergillus wentii DTO 134E9]
MTLATSLDASFKPSPSRVRTSNWADGLRGIAAVFVVASHTTLCFARYVVPPSFSETGHIALFQRPFLRLVGQGQSFVAIFFILLGFVNSLKAVQLARTGAVHDALASLATSAFRRTGRLVFPAALVTVIVWFFCQLGAFQVALKVDAFWLQTTSPRPSRSWGAAVADLLRQLFSTWIYGDNAYDQPQWALVYLFKGSLYVFMTLLATVNATPRFRLFTELVLYMWSWAIGDGIVGLNVFAGMIMAEFSFHPIYKFPQTSRLPSILPSCLLILGLYLCSFPDQFYDQTPWSAQLAHIGGAIIPSNASMGRYFAAWGGQMVCLAVFLSPSFRRFFSHPSFLWLGSISYSLYLLHGPLMRSVMTYMLYIPAIFTFTPALREDGSPDPGSLIPDPSFVRLCLFLPVFFTFVLAVSRLWTVKVEPRLGAASDSFERFARTWGRGYVPRSPKVDHDTLLPMAVKE